MEVYGVMEVYLHTFVTSGIDGGKCSGLSHCVGGWVGSQGRSVEKRMMPWLYGESNPYSAIVQPAA
jgi:hypothetical protein